MRNLEQYQIIFCDIDDTLIYGFWTELMKHTWNMFRNNTLSDILMTVQEKLNIYTVNQKLKHMLLNCTTPVVFLTARKHVPATEKMIARILEVDRTEKVFEIRNLATDNPAEDKYNEIVRYIHNYLDMDVELDKLCLFDDNKSVRDLIATLDVDVFDPVAMREDVR